MFIVIQEFASYEDSTRREQWRRSLSAQIASWKERVTQAMRLSATIGVTIGGVAVTATGAAVIMVQGVVRGVRRSPSPSSRRNPTVSLPLDNHVNIPVPDNDLTTEDPYAGSFLRPKRASGRARSEERPMAGRTLKEALDVGHYMACHTAP